MLNKYLYKYSLKQLFHFFVSIRNFGILTSLFLSTLLLSLPAQADFEDDDIFMMLSGDEELISIATGTPRPVSKAPAVTSVITAEEIRSSGANTVEQALERVPGLHIGISPLNRGKSLFSFRGIQTVNNPQTLFLVNGHTIPDTFSGSIAPTLFLPVENIARIEVIRGPGSAVYGADAFAGVINIITKTAKDINGAQAGVRTGSFNTQNVWGLYGGESSGWQIAASLEYNKSDGDSGRIIENDLQGILDASPLYSASATLAPGPFESRYESIVSGLTLAKDEWQLQFNSWNQRDTGVGAGIANALDPVGKTDINQYLMSLEYNKKDWLPDWALKVDASYMYGEIDTEYVIFPAGTRLPIGSDGNINFASPSVISFTDGFLGNPASTGKEAQFDVTSFYSGMLAHQWRFNAGVKSTKETDKATQNFGPGVLDGTEGTVDGSLTDVTGTANIYHPGASRSIVYLSVQDEWQFAPDWILTTGLRFDDYSDVGSTTNPRLSLVWNTLHNLTSKLLYGRAFRAPTFSELNAQNNPITTGNPNLDPEIINTLELAFDYKPTQKLAVLLNMFHYEINGLIDFIPDGNGGSSTAQNAIDQKANGFELEARWQLTKTFRVFGNGAFQNAENKDTGMKVADAPRKQIRLGANWQHNAKWNSQLDAYSIMDRPRAAGDGRARISDYNWVNLSLNGRNIVEGMSMRITVRNLLNEDAREPGPATIANDYPLEGRSVYIEVSHRF